MSDLLNALKCDDCGRFMTWSEGASMARMYDFAAMEPSYDHYRCASCGEKLGLAQSNAMPHDGDMSPFQSVFTPEPRP